MTPFEIEQREERIIACFREGWGNRRIAEHFNVTDRTVTRWRTQHDARKWTNRPHPPSERRRAEELLNEGASFSEAARTVGVSAKTIYRWFPERHAWTREQVAEYVVMSRTMGRLVA